MATVSNSARPSNCKAFTPISVHLPFVSPHGLHVHRIDSRPYKNGAHIRLFRTETELDRLAQHDSPHSLSLSCAHLVAP